MSLSSRTKGEEDWFAITKYIGSTDMRTKPDATKSVSIILDWSFEYRSGYVGSLRSNMDLNKKVRTESRIN